jgi:hypothetical protein
MGERRVEALRARVGGAAIRHECSDRSRCTEEVVVTERIGAILLIVGSTVFLIGAAAGVPGVFTQRDPQVRLRMLTERLRAWQVAQPLYGVGPVIAAAGVAFLAAGSDGGSRAVLTASCAALAFGAVAWGWSLYLRGTRVSEFAFGTLPGWPFATYVLLTTGGIALLAIGLIVGDFQTWLGWLTLGTDVVFLGAYLRFKDIPPSSSTCSSYWLAWPFFDLAAAVGLRNVSYGDGRVSYGEGRNRTGDTTVFSRVLYRLSYLASRRVSVAKPCGSLGPCVAAASRILVIFHQVTPGLGRSPRGARASGRALPGLRSESR